jgi:hypothetical protein
VLTRKLRKHYFIYNTNKSIIKFCFNNQNLIILREKIKRFYKVNKNLIKTNKKRLKISKEQLKNIIKRVGLIEILRLLIKFRTKVVRKTKKYIRTNRIAEEVFENLRKKNRHRRSRYLGLVAEQNLKQEENAKKIKFIIEPEQNKIRICRKLLKQAKVVKFYYKIKTNKKRLKNKKKLIKTNFKRKRFLSKFKLKKNIKKNIKKYKKYNLKNQLGRYKQLFRKFKVIHCSSPRRKRLKCLDRFAILKISRY